MSAATHATAAGPAGASTASRRSLIYVPGMRAKPPPQAHRVLLWQCLLEGVRRADAAAAASLAAAPEILRLAAWGHLFYPEYRDPRLDQAGIAALLSDATPGPASVREVYGPRHRLRYLAHRAADRLPALAPWLAGAATRQNLRDAARYFANEGGIADQVRQLVAAELQAAWDAGHSVLLMAHSLGSVIAWDTLWALSRGPGARRPPGPVDLLLTLGSPLGTRFVQRRLLGSRREGPERYPLGIRRWQNLAARGGLTALGHRLARTYAPMRRLGLVEAIADQTDLINPFRGPEGLNVHRCYGYFVNPATGRAVAGWWQGTAQGPDWRRPSQPRDR